MAQLCLCWPQRRKQHFFQKTASRGTWLPQSWGGQLFLLGSQVQAPPWAERLLKTKTKTKTKHPGLQVVTSKKGKEDPWLRKCQRGTVVLGRTLRSLEGSRFGANPRCIPHYLNRPGKLLRCPEFMEAFTANPEWPYALPVQWNHTVPQAVTIQWLSLLPLPWEEI